MSLCEVDTVKIEKERAMQQYRRFKKIASLARTLQFCLAFIFLSWSLSRSSSFPNAVEFCGFLLRRLCALSVNHHFGFLLGNLIIVTLFLKSGRSSCNKNGIASAVTGNAGDYDGGYQIRQLVAPREMEAVSDSPEETKFPSPVDGDDLAVRRAESEPRRYRRTRSEEFERKVTEKVQLQRSATQSRGREMESLATESTGKRRTRVEDLSNEEFQRKVEAFIERQQRFLREESLIRK